MLTTVAAGRVFDYSHSVGMYALDGQGFYAPVDFALTDNGIIYVVNRGGLAQYQRVTKLTTDHQYLGQLGSSGSGDGQFMWPSCIALDQEENLYVGDDYLQNITVLDKEGKFLRKWGSQGQGDGEVDGPSGLAFDREDTLFVADAKNHRVQKFNREGEFLAKWGTHGSADGELDMPWGICFDGDGNVLIADWGNRRIQKFTPDGQFLARFGGPGSGAGELNRPSGVSVDSEGDVYVTDWNAHKLHVYSPDGSFITALIGDAQELSPWGQVYIAANPEFVKARRRVNLEEEWRFKRPVAVKVGANDQIFVLETWRCRLQVYDKTKEYQEHALNL